MDGSIQKYQAFLKAVEYGSFTKAAEILHYSQSGISRMIADLEKEWRIVLLERGKGGVRLTSDGTKILPLVQQLCNAHEALQTKVDALKGLESGLIRIGTFSSVATHWLPNIIRAFQTDYPRIDFELLLGDYAEIENWIRTGRVDCGFLRLPTDPEFDTIFLQQDELMAILPEQHPMAQADVVPIAAFCDEPFVLLARGENKEFYEIFPQHGLSVAPRFTTWDDYAVMSMVECGLGISILPQLILRRIPYRIVAKPLDIPAHREICLALRNRTSASLAVRRFLEYLPFRDQQS